MSIRTNLAEIQFRLFQCQGAIAVLDAQEKSSLPPEPPPEVDVALDSEEEVLPELPPEEPWLEETLLDEPSVEEVVVEGSGLNQDPFMRGTNLYRGPNGRFTSKASSGKGEYNFGELQKSYADLSSGDSGDNISWPVNQKQKRTFYGKGVKDSHGDPVVEETKKEAPKDKNGNPFIGKELTAWKIENGGEEDNDHGVIWPPKKKGILNLVLEYKGDPQPWPQDKEGNYLKGEELIAWKIESNPGHPANSDNSRDGVSWPTNMFGNPLSWPSVKDAGGQKRYLVGPLITEWKKANGGELDGDRRNRPEKIDDFVRQAETYKELSEALNTVVITGDIKDPAVRAQIAFRKRLQSEIESQIADVASATLGEKKKKPKPSSKRAIREERFRKMAKWLTAEDTWGVTQFVLGTGDLSGESREERVLDHLTDAYEHTLGTVALAGDIARIATALPLVAVNAPLQFWFRKPPEEREKIVEAHVGLATAVLDGVSGGGTKGITDIQEYNKAHPPLDEATRKRQEEARKAHAEEIQKRIEEAQKRWEEQAKILESAKQYALDNNNQTPPNVLRIDVAKSTPETTPELDALISESASFMATSAAEAISQSQAVREGVAQVKALKSAGEEIAETRIQSSRRSPVTHTNKARFPLKPLKSLDDIAEWDMDAFGAIEQANTAPIELVLFLCQVPEFREFVKQEMRRVLP
jgi:hypothetical protein